MSEVSSMIRPRPHFNASYTVHISPTNNEFGTAMWAAADCWITEGYELQRIIGMLYGFAPERIDLQDQELATERYDVAMVPPNGMGEEAMKETIRTALQRHLSLLLITDHRRRNVYVVTAPDGPKAPLKAVEDTGTTIHVGGGGINMRSGSMEDFCLMLEGDLDRPVIDETQLQGCYSVEVRREDKTRDQFFEQLRNELGLLVSSAERDVSLLVVRRR
ncbi:MAG: TIGR03435 family protein [Janthinobacterium lividum]